jgi:hypothetical protein
MVASSVIIVNDHCNIIRTTHRRGQVSAKHTRSLLRLWCPRPALLALIVVTVILFSKRGEG